ncbi:unnamed protein product [Mycena citricolor]|uniref:CRA domain-containing protein n=1 Tax=Mycena citricolor TaxID=2018698 RepID=A0AAD2HPC3_9AGAR|nr:unnamed protein product [Mycena citricolor]
MTTRPEHTPYQLRALIIDYLIHHGHSSTARAFAEGSMIQPKLDADGDEIMRVADSLDPLLSDEMFTQVELRQRVRQCIVSGQVATAIELVELHFPTVLSASPPTTLPKSLTGTTFIAPTTLDPAHLSLNLRILAFIEALRSALDLIRDQSTPMKEDDPQIMGLFSKAKKLRVLVSMLTHPHERADYDKEVENVIALLAYPDPEASPVAKYLSQERREAVANQINTAILYRTGFPATSKLELSARYTSTLWSFLHDLRVKPRPGAPLPPAGVDKSATPSLKGVKPAEKDEPETPRFDLSQFLDSKV